MRADLAGFVVQSCAACGSRADEFFCNLDDTDLKDLDRLAFSTVYPAGAILFAEGQRPRGVHLLCRGRVKLSMSAADGKTLISRIVHKGELLGLSSCVTNHPYKTTAETLEPTQVKFLQREDFLRLLAAKKPSLNALAQLSQECEDAEDHVATLGLSHSAAAKLGQLLLTWCNEIGEPREAGIRVPFLSTHDEIAQMISTSRETVTRLLHEFREQNIISLSGSSLIVHDKSALESLVIR